MFAFFEDIVKGIGLEPRSDASEAFVLPLDDLVDLCSMSYAWKPVWSFETY